MVNTEGKRFRRGTIQSRLIQKERERERQTDKISLCQPNVLVPFLHCTSHPFRSIRCKFDNHDSLTFIETALCER